jgi:hypothetical protein
VDDNFESSDKVFLIDATRDVQNNDNILTIEGGRIGSGFTQGLSMNQGGKWCFREVAVDEPLRFTMGGSTTLLSDANGRLSLAIVDGVISGDGCRQEPRTHPQPSMIPFPHKPGQRQDRR